MKGDQSDCTLDQWLTSAAAAIEFAVSNWDQFRAHLESAIGRKIPIGRETMLHHGEHLIRLIDPEWMPDE